MTGEKKTNGIIWARRAPDMYRPLLPCGVSTVSGHRLYRTLVSPLCCPTPFSQAEAETKLLPSTRAVFIPTALISSRGNGLLFGTTQFTDPSVQLSKQNWEENPHLFLREFKVNRMLILALKFGAKVTESEAGWHAAPEAGLLFWFC